jgi:predicted ATPase/class 3 adenylate cyclase
MTAAQPSGTVTLVFTDIEGSTRLLEQLGTDAYREALAEHRHVVREACARHQGYEVDCEGDAFFVTFHAADAAVAAVTEAMRGLEGGPIRIRVGIHTGEPGLDGPNYIGLDVHRAARIMAAAHGGQVVLSRHTAQLLDGSVELKDLGEHRFKDLDAPERIYQLGHQDHPRLKSLYHVTLPVPATHFLGREAELTQVVERLLDPDTRLLTLTGPGGTGKTRLALQAAAAASDHYPDGTTWIPLAPLRDPSLVIPTIARAVGVAERPGDDLTATLAAGLLGKQTLILLDNVEQLLPLAAHEIAALLAECPTLRVLATSRERLRIRAETTWPVPGLDPADGERLFLDRAHRAGADVAPNDPIRELCSRLDELPLAIELAAARTNMLSVAAILEHLDRALDILSTRDRDVEDRQRTLAATIAWSYDLLDLDEQRTLRALSVFAGGFPFDAARHVADADLDLLESLHDKSLLRRNRGHTGADRYWMLETIREYAAERLAANGDETTARRRHARWFADNAAKTPDDERATVLKDDDDNLRVALSSAIAQEPELAARLCRLLTPYWFYRGQMREADHWGRVLLSTTTEQHGRRAEALALAGRFRLFVDEPRSARALLEESLAIFRAEGDRLGLARCLADLGTVATMEGRSDDAIAALTEAAALHRGLDDEPYEATVDLHALAEALRDAGRLDEARARFEDVIATLRAIGADVMAASSIHSLGDLELDDGRTQPAQALYRDALATFAGTVMEREIANCLGGLASAAAAAGDTHRAARLWGALEALEERLELQLFEHERRRYAARVSTACATHPAAYAEGRTWTLGESIAYALGEVTVPARADELSRLG